MEAKENVLVQVLPSTTPFDTWNSLKVSLFLRSVSPSKPQRRVDEPIFGNPNPVRLESVVSQQSVLRCFLTNPFHTDRPCAAYYTCPDRSSGSLSWVIDGRDAC